MTNEEKARELALAYQQEDDGHIERIIREDALEEMAEWKDHQFKEYLEKRLCDAKSVYEMSHHEDYAGGFMDAINEIINELFKED